MAEFIMTVAAASRVVYTVHGEKVQISASGQMKQEKEAG